MEQAIGESQTSLYVQGLQQTSPWMGLREEEFSLMNLARSQAALVGHLEASRLVLMTEIGRLLSGPARMASEQGGEFNSDALGQ